MSILTDYYNIREEDKRFASNHCKVEYLTTIKYIRTILADFEDPKILEIGAGTGAYSVTLAKEGYDITAVELVKHNLDILESKLDGSERIRTYEGNALDLSLFEDESFDVTLVLGPMYHLFTREDKVQAMKEAVRVTKNNGYLFVAYCMNEATILQYVFKGNHLKDVKKKNLLTEDWHCISEETEIFDLVRVEDIESLNALFPVERIKLIAADGPSHYMSETIDAMDEELFEKWMEFHFATCERLDLVGASNHTLDILKKK